MAGAVSGAELLAQSRADLALTLQQFATLLSRSIGTVISRQRLSAFERGRAVPRLLLLEIAEVCASLPILDQQLRDGWHELLRDPQIIPHVAVPTTEQRRNLLRLLAERIQDNPRWPLYRALADEAGMNLDANLAEARRRLALDPAENDWRTEPTDLVLINKSASLLEIEVEHGGLFVFSATLINAGRTAWRDRLLLRLGPPVASSLAFTPPILSVPDTPPGDTCRVAIPGRSPWFPNLTVITYAMTFPDCRPAAGGSLQLFIDAKEEHGRTSHPLPTAVAARLRRHRTSPTQ
jgi:hypothetical protein